MAEEPRTVIVDRSSSGGGLTAIIALVVLAIIGVAAYFLVTQENHKDNAVSTAAQQVGDAAQQAGDAAQEAARKQ